jgi:hypothetical protein
MIYNIGQRSTAVFDENMSAFTGNNDACSLFSIVVHI